MRFSIVQMDMFLMVYIVTNLSIAGGAQIFPYRKQRVENGQNIAGELPTNDVVLITLLTGARYMSEKLGIKYYEKYGGYARALREFKELDLVHLIEWGNGSATGITEGRGIHFEPNEDTSSPSAIIVTGKYSVIPKFVIYYKKRVMARLNV